MKKIKMAIVSMCLTLLATIGMVAGTAAPAEAASAGLCRWAYNIQVCTSLTFVANGIVVTSIGHTTPNGCDQLGSPRYIYKAASVSTMDYYWGSRDCNQLEGVYNGCGSCTTRHVVIYLKTNVKYDYDYEWAFHYNLRRDGTSSGWVDLNVGPCC